MGNSCKWFADYQKNCKTPPGQADPNSDCIFCRMGGTRCDKQHYGSCTRCFSDEQVRDKEFAFKDWCPNLDAFTNFGTLENLRAHPEVWKSYCADSSKKDDIDHKYFCNGDLPLECKNDADCFTHWVGAGAKEGFTGIFDSVLAGYKFIICNTVGYIPGIGPWLCAGANNIVLLAIIAGIIILVFLIVEYVILPIIEITALSKK